MTAGRPATGGLSLFRCRKRGTRTAALLLTATLAGCDSGPESPSIGPRAEWLHRGGQCSPEEAVAVPLERAVEAGFALPGKHRPRTGPGHYVAVGLGRFPTAGYGISLAKIRRDPETGRVIVRVRAEDPPEGSAVAQVLTFPCGVLRVTTPGARRTEVRVEYRNEGWRVGGAVSR